MKKKLFAGLIAAAMIALTAAAASAATPLSPQEIVEQLAVPMATANDPDVGINNFYSAEELAEIVRILDENGIELEENSTVMQMVTNGYGLFEETVITAICEQAFGRDSGWTLEEQDWYNEQLTRIGSYESHSSCLPGPDNMTAADAEAFALASVRKAYGEDLPLEDRSIWKLYRTFTPADRENPETCWFFRLQPRDMEHGSYSVSFSDSDPAESVSVEGDESDWTDYTAEQLLTRFQQIYSSQETWPQAVWQLLHEMMRQKKPDPGEFQYPEFRGYQLTGYPEPDAQEISREEAIRIARDTVKKDRAALDSAVLTEYGGERAWLVKLVIWTPWDRTEDPEAGSWIVTVDSTVGTVRSLRDECSWYEAYIPEAACRKAEEEVPEKPDYLRIAAEAVRDQYPDLDPLDETEYRASVMGLYTCYVDFITKTIQHGSISVVLSQDGEVQELTVDEEGPSCDNLFDRYWKIHGYFGQWNQVIWVQLDRDKTGLKAKSADGKILKMTHFPEESSVRIGHEEAQKLGMKAAGTRRAEVNTCVLVDAKPHPVWIMRIIAGEDAVIGIDAETGKTVFTEPFDVDETPHYVLYSMPKTWRKLKKK